MRALALALAVLAVAAAPALAARSLRAVGSLPPTSTLPTEDCLNAFVAILEAGKCNPKKSPLATCCAAYASLGANCLQSMLDFMASDPKLKDISEATQANLKLCGGDNPNPDPLPDDACVEAFMATVAEDGGCGAATATAATCCAALGGLPEGCLDSIVAYLETQPEAATVVDTIKRVMATCDGPNPGTCDVAGQFADGGKCTDSLEACCPALQAQGEECLVDFLKGLEADTQQAFVDLLVACGIAREEETAARRSALQASPLARAARAMPRPCPGCTAAAVHLARAALAARPARRRAAMQVARTPLLALGPVPAYKA